MQYCLICGQPIQGKAVMRRMGSLNAKLPDGTVRSKHEDVAMHPECASAADHAQWRYLAIAGVFFIALVVALYLYINRGD
jgi:hypothetical protein